MKTIFWKTMNEINKRWLAAAGLNLMLFVLLILVFPMFEGAVEGLDIENLMAQRELLLSQGMMADNIGQAEQMSEGMYSALSLLVVYFIGFIAFVIVAYSSITYFIYKIVYKDKFKIKSLLKYLAFNTAFGGIVFFLTVHGFKLLKPTSTPVVLVIEALLLLYVFTFFNLYYFREEKVFLAVKKLYFLTITKIHRLLGSIGLTALMFLVLLIPFYVLNLLLLQTWILLIPLLFSLTFSRYYFKNVLESKQYKDI